MIRLVRVFLVLGVVLGLTGQATAAPVAPIDKGAGGVLWGGDPATAPGFMKLKTLDGIDYFVNLRERLEIKGFAKPTVFYGVVDGKLFAVHLRMKESAAYDTLKAQLAAAYGPGKQSRVDGGRMTRWKAGKLRVKLKYDAEGETKLSFYYQPVVVTQGSAARESEHNQELMRQLSKSSGPAAAPVKLEEPVEAIDLMNILKKGRN